MQYNLAAQPQYLCLSAYKVIIHSVSQRWFSKKYNDLSDVNGFVNCISKVNLATLYNVIVSALPLKIVVFFVQL